MKPSILFVHQSAELYGSDRVLLGLLIHLQQRGYRLKVLLPAEGELTKVLQQETIEYQIEPVWRLHSGLKKPRLWLPFMLEAVRSVWQLNRAVKQFQPDIIYSNSLATLSGVVVARYRGIRHLWHLHEVVPGHTGCAVGRAV